MEPRKSKRGRKLYYYLSRLKEKEIRDFHDYLLSPLLGNSPQFARMLLIMRDKVLLSGRTTIDADLFQEEFFPGQDLDAKKAQYIRIRLVQFQDKLLEFAAFMDYRSDRNAQDIHLLKALYKRGWEKHFEKIYREVEAKPPLKQHGEYLMYKFWRAVVWNDFLAERIAMGDNKELNLILDRIDQLFLHIKVKYFTAVHNDVISGASPVPLTMQNEVLEWSKKMQWDDSPESVAYCYAFQMFSALMDKTEEGDELFPLLQQYLDSTQEKDVSELRDLFYFANNYCLLKIRHGVLAFRKELIELYSVTLRRGDLLEAGMISKEFYKGMINNVCRIGEIEWAESILEEWKEQIAGDVDYLAYYHNKAQIHFNKGEYDETIEVLYNRLHLYQDAIFGLSARINICRALWEKGEHQWLVANLEAFRQLVRRLKKIERSERIDYELFIGYLSRMCHAKMGSPDKTLNKLVNVRDELIEKGLEYRFLWLYKSIEIAITQHSKRSKN